MIDIRRWLRFALLILAVAALPATLAAQGPRLQGEVIDQSGAPVGGVAVSVHRVTEAGGAEVGRAVTDAEGRFTIELDAAPADGVYFAATRFEGNLYMGEVFRGLSEVPAEYRIVIGSGGIAGGPAVTPPPPPSTGRGIGVLLIFAAAGVAAVSIPFLRSRRDPRAARGILAEIAVLDEEFASRPESARARGEAEYRAARAALRARLKALAVAESNAADDH